MLEEIIIQTLMKAVKETNLKIHSKMKILVE